MSLQSALWKPGTLTNSRPLTECKFALWEKFEERDVQVVKAEMGKEMVLSLI